MTNILISLGITALVVVTTQEVLGLRMHSFAVLVLYFGLYAGVSWIRSRRTRTDADFPDDAPPDRSEWPLSGPLASLGRWVGGGLFALIFTVTGALSLLNPLQFAQMVRQITWNGRLQAREKERATSGTSYTNKVEYRLPFKGEWWVFNGGMTPKTSHSWDILGQRFALDFVKVDGELRRHRGKGIRLEEYLCYDEPILAAADGAVVRVEGRISDAPLVGFGFCDFLARGFIGNHVLIRHAEGEYGLYAHLVPGSLQVEPGDRVEQGQPIGRCGHSGHSSEPHLHFHLQDAPELFGGMGLPVTFVSVEVDGEPVPSARLVAGRRIRNLR